MINILKFFSDSNIIESGGANVEKYEFKIYKKTYDRFVKRGYDNIDPFSVDNHVHYENECKYLTLLEKYDVCPNIIDKIDHTLILTDCGEQLTVSNVPIDWKDQIHNIYNVLKTEHIFHNDIKMSNFTVKNNKLYLIDFGWSSQYIPSYPYLNLNLNIVTASDTIDDLFNSLFNDTANIVIKMALNLNNYINRSLRHK